MEHIRNSKVVEIHRKPSFIEQANPGEEVQEYFGMSYKSIGSYWKEVGTPNTGLTRQEEEALLPEVLGNIDPVKDHRDFREKVKAYYENFNTKIPPEGLRLEIGLESPEGNMITVDKATNEVRLTNPPNRLMDYLRYRHALGHPQVGKNKDEAERYQHMLFYIKDRVEETKGRTTLRDKEDLAQREYLSMNKDMSKVEMVLTLLGVSTKGMSNDDMVLELKAKASIDPEQSDAKNIEDLEKFVKVVNDKELIAKYDILEMIRFGILERVRTKILIKESNEPIGDNLKEAVVWLLDKGNSKQVNSFYAQLDSLGKDRRIKHGSPHLQDPRSEAKAAKSETKPDKE